MEPDWTNSLFQIFVPYYKLPSNYFDQEIHSIRSAKIKAVSENMANHYTLKMAKWVAVASVIKLDLETWLNYDDFWQEAIYLSVQEYVKSVKSQEQKEMGDFMKTLGSKDEASKLSPVQRPNFALP